MAVVGTPESLFTIVYSTLTADNTLKGLCGGTVRLYPVWALPDAAFPYLVQRVDISGIDDFWPMRLGTLYLDIWSNSSDANEVLAIRDRIIALIDELDSSTDDVSHARISLQTEGFIPETEQDIWHYACQFNIRFYRKSEAAAIIGR